MNPSHSIHEICTVEAQLDEQARARVAAAWAELVEAAKHEPKARAFLEAFGSIATGHTVSLNAIQGEKSKP